MSPADITAIIDSLPAERKPHDGEQLAKELVRLKKLTAYQAQQIYVGKGRSLVLGEYVILDKLGQGGMGAGTQGRASADETVGGVKGLVAQGDQDAGGFATVPA
jgi:hypothetical protein